MSNETKKRNKRIIFRYAQGAVVGSIVATANIPKDQQDDILKQLFDFIKYVYDQQTQTSALTKQNNQPSEAFGKWKPK